MTRIQKSKPIVTTGLAGAVAFLISFSAVLRSEDVSFEPAVLNHVQLDTVTAAAGVDIYTDAQAMASGDRAATSTDTDARTRAFRRVAVGNGRAYAEAAGGSYNFADTKVDGAGDGDTVYRVDFKVDIDGVYKSLSVSRIGIVAAESPLSKLD